MTPANRISRIEVGEFVRERTERTAESVVGGVVGGFLDAIALDDEGVAVGVVGFVSSKVDLAE